MNRNHALAAIALAAIIAATPVAADAATLPRPVYAVYVVADISGQTLAVDGPYTTLAAAQTDQQREQAIFDRYCTVVDALCADVTIR